MSKIDYSYFVGDWKNSHKVSKGIDAFVISESDNGPQISVSGIESGYFPGDWGSTSIEFLVSGPGQSTASAFQATYQIGHELRF